ncbi:MAG TPA: GNAT family protein [Steroidobacteraceae bacterium]|nr:GNAT family protein [Steroidobacteraceae bacterium]
MSGAVKAEPGRRFPRTRRLALPLVSPRLEIREFVEEDLEALCDVLADPRVTRYMLHSPRKRSEVEGYLEQVLGFQREQPRSAWELAVTDRHEGTLIGACTLTFLAPGEADLGYLLARRVWRQGLASEIAAVLVDAGFERLSLTRVSSTVDVRNLASIRVLEKTGLRWEATLRRLRKVRGEWRDCHLLAISRTEWEAARADA